jgi:hypothetical protein
MSTWMIARSVAMAAIVPICLAYVGAGLGRLQALP